MSNTIIKIEPGKTYRDGWGKEHKVMGKALRSCEPRVEYADVYWCSTGFWFFEDGRQHYGGRIDQPTNYDLREEVTS